MWFSVALGFVGLAMLGLAIIILSVRHIHLANTYTDGPVRLEIWIAMSVVLIGMDANVRLIRPWQQLRRPWVLEAVESQPGDTWQSKLRGDGHEGMQFEPGPFARITIDRSSFDIREHPFSFSSNAEWGDVVSFGAQEFGDFASTLGEYEPGTRAYLDGPYGAFSYERNEAPAFVFIAGGIGITPCRACSRRWPTARISSRSCGSMPTRAGRRPRSAMSSRAADNGST